ncbi:hypothetical protein A45J_2631 [hot springs metagenome]|uniref:Type-F conjugative transfer system pilin assembly protein TrbC n=1 Tax=hot springs metagenome TaxID=433727 RepID=A0A5J4L3L6_9ZZZZ
MLRVSVSLTFIFIVLLFVSVVSAEEGLKTIYVDTPNLCYKLDRVEDNKVYIVSTRDECTQIMGKIAVKISKDIKSVYIITNGVFWKEMKVEDDVTNKFQNLLPKKEDLEKASQYAKLKDKTDIHPIKEQEKQKEDKKQITIKKPEKEEYIFYLFSKSVPDITLESVFNQSKKLPNINFYGVLRGIDKTHSVFEKIKNIKGFEDITIKVNPLIFKAVGAQVVPAIVYAYCPPPDMFRSAECDYQYVVYGDISLAGALEVMGEHNIRLKELSEELHEL